MEVDEAPHDEGAERPDDVVSVQEMGFECAEEDVSADALIGDGLQDFVLSWAERSGGTGFGRGGRVPTRGWGFMTVRPWQEFEQRLDGGG